MVMAAAFTLSFVSCGDDDIEYEGVILEDGDFIEIGASTQNDANYNQGFGYDTTAAYPAHFKVTLRNGKLVITNLTAQNTAESLQIPGMNLRDRLPALETTARSTPFRRSTPTLVPTSTATRWLPRRSTAMLSRFMAR